MPRTRKTKGPDLRNVRRAFNLMCCGYKDFEERQPGKRQPEGPPLSDDVVAYWEGFNAAAQDAASAFFRERRHAPERLAA